jgi:2-keto-3-deoxy-L-fuconate dehydrogenase
MFSLKNKQAVVTGATVHIIELNADAAEQTVQEIAADGTQAFAYSANVVDQQQVISVFNQIGRIDILVNNAGIAHVGNVEKTTEADFEKVYSVNVKGAYNCLFAAIPVMKAQGGGVIVSMASIASWVGIADRFAYSMSKGAIHAISLSIARLFARSYSQ